MTPFHSALRKWLALLIAALPILAACSGRLTTTINPDGSGTLQVEIGFTPDDQAQLAAAGQTPEGRCTQILATLPTIAPPPLEVEARGDQVWCRAGLAFGQLSDLQRILQSSPAVAVNQLSLAGERLSYDLLLDLRQARRLGLRELPIQEFAWTLIYPGSLSGHNADQIEAETLTWFLEPGSLRTLRAESALSTPSSTIAGIPRLTAYLIGLVIACLLLPLTLAILLWRFLRRRRRQTA